MRKKLISVIVTFLMAAMLAVGIAACGKSIGTGPQNTTTAAQASSKKTDKEQETTKKDAKNSTSETEAATTANAGNAGTGQNTEATAPAQNGGGSAPAAGGTYTPPAANGGGSAPAGGSGAPAETQTAAPAPEPQTEAPTQPPAPVWNVSVSVSGGEYGGYFGGGTFSYNYQPTAFDVLVSTGLPYTGSGYYVSSINGLGEFDHGPMSGWLYAVNGSTPGVGCGSCYLNDGDSVSWFYQGDE